MVDKFINDKGEVAVLYCPGFGAGWASWNSSKDNCLYDPVIVQAVLDKKDPAELAKIAKERYPDAYVGGVKDGLEIEWVPQGEKFYLHEYDGSEHIVREDEFCVA